MWFSLAKILDFFDFFVQILERKNPLRFFTKILQNFDFFAKILENLDFFVKISKNLDFFVEIVENQANFFREKS